MKSVVDDMDVVGSRVTGSGYLVLLGGVPGCGCRMVARHVYICCYYLSVCLSDRSRIYLSPIYSLIPPVTHDLRSLSLLPRGGTPPWASHLGQGRPSHPAPHPARGLRGHARRPRPHPHPPGAGISFRHLAGLWGARHEVEVEIGVTEDVVVGELELFTRPGVLVEYEATG